MPKWLMFAAVALVPVVLLVSQPEVKAQEPFVAGKDYAVIEKPVRTGSPNKVEVTEVFWYGCPHCSQFQPAFDDWRKQKQSDDLVIRHSPAMWNKKMEVHARIFYTASVLGKQDVMHRDIFDAMHVHKKRLLKEPEIFTLFEKHGITKEQFDKTFKSFGVNSMVQQANARARAYGISGTPEVIINGKYRVSAGMTGSQQRMLEVTDYLIKKEKASLATKS